MSKNEITTTFLICGLGILFISFIVISVLRYKARKKYGRPTKPLNYENLLNQDIEIVNQRLGTPLESEFKKGSTLSIYEVKSEKPEGIWKLKIESNNKGLIKAFDIRFTSPLSKFLSEGRIKIIFGAKIIRSNHHT